MGTQTVALLASLMLVASTPSAFADDGDDGAERTSRSSAVKIQLLADFVVGGEPADGVTAVTDMRTTGIGWGALFKIYKLAAAMDVDPSTLVGEIGPDGEFEFSFGEAKKLMDEAQRAAFDAMPKNFGTLVAAARRSDKAAEKAVERDERRADHKAERDERKADRKAERDARKDARDAARAERWGGSDDGDDDGSED